MRLSIFGEKDRVLLLGEGNFSFAVSLVEHNLPIAITASCYEFCVTEAKAKKNIDYLKAHGVRTILGVDGTKLEEHPIIGMENFDKIIFNFPHVGGKMRIDKNRELLRNFFVSAEKLVERTEGSILVTLCNGQGGTIRDCPKRRWDDSWKVTEMAAHGNFVLTSVEPFCVWKFKNYTSTGYRSLDKEFNVENSLTHFFKRVEVPSSADFAPIVKLDSSKFEKEENGIKYLNILPSSITEHSLCPLLYKFDTTFSVTPEFKEIELFTVLYNNVGKIINNIEFVRSYRFPGLEKETRTYRISYQSANFPLYREKIVDIHEKIVAKILEDHLNVIVTR